MMGDDTWMQLFPSHFSEAHPFPSFNVKDLHTVCGFYLFHQVTDLCTLWVFFCHTSLDVVTCLLLSVGCEVVNWSPSSLLIVQSLSLSWP
jgi:hypothetical protein